MRETTKQSLLQEIRESEGRQASANPLTKLMQQVARMPRLSRSKQCSRTGSLPARKRRSRLPRTGYLANPASLIGIPRLEPVHAGNKISFGSSALTALAQTLVEIDQANESDWIAAEKTPSTLVEHVLRRYLADRGQSAIAEHFELSLTLGEAIVDSVYGEAEPASPGQLFFVLNTESSFALGVGDAITELEGSLRRHGTGILRRPAPVSIPLDPCL